jgi:hypothetical protein
MSSSPKPTHGDVANEYYDILPVARQEPAERLAAGNPDA